MISESLGQRDLLPSLTTSRLTLSLLTSAKRGEPELDWLHELLSNEKTSFWSISGQSKSVEETAARAKNYLTFENPTGDGERYRLAYAVHRFLTSEVANEAPKRIGQPSTEFIGLVTMKAIGSSNLALPEHLTIPNSEMTTTLMVEVAYQFLPKSWGLGYATEAVNAVFDACRKSPSFWSPYVKLYVRALVNPGNPASQRVMDKVGMTKKGTYEWFGKAVFVGGEWRERDTILIYGQYLIE